MENKQMIKNREQGDITIIHKKNELTRRLNKTKRTNEKQKNKNRDETNKNKKQ